MKVVRTRWPFVLLILAGIAVLLVSFVDMVLQKGWFQHVIVSYIILIILAVVLIVLTKVIEAPEIFKELEEFEKLPGGRINHFKCPQCGSFFAIQEAQHEQKHTLKITCPSCGVTGAIPLKPQTNKEKIPSKKSKPLRFKCDKCNEEIMVWAEGGDIVTDVKITVCPYCGEQNTLRKIKD